MPPLRRQVPRQPRPDEEPARVLIVDPDVRPRHVLGLGRQRRHGCRPRPTSAAGPARRPVRQHRARSVPCTIRTGLRDGNPAPAAPPERAARRVEAVRLPRATRSPHSPTLPRPAATSLLPMKSTRNPSCPCRSRPRRPPVGIFSTPAHAPAPPASARHSDQRLTFAADIPVADVVARPRLGSPADSDRRSCRTRCWW